MEKATELLLAFYGDDFTGSTDALEFLSRSGVRTVLFIEPPGPAQLEKYEGLGAIGIAGMSRSMPSEEMEKELRPAFSALKKTGARHVHYKVCSTFDSSPTIGSIGKAIDIGAEIFSVPYIPLLIAAPILGRYCLFGNLFARMGIGSKGSIHRLDRHPSMSKHPVTPADESDLRIQLSRQTDKKIGLLDILEISKPKPQAEQALEEILSEGTEIVLFDALYQDQMAKIGAILDALGSEEQPLFTVGSSGVEMALGDFWKEQGHLQGSTKWEDPGEAGPILVASGSCSPVTGKQISWAVSEGFAEVAMDTAAMIIQENSKDALLEYVLEIIINIEEGKSVILHTNCGEDDERLKKTGEILSQQRMNNENTAKIFGTALGEIVRAVAERTEIKRIVIAGGDTSGFAARAMGIEALEMIAPLSPGAPLCKAYAPASAVDGLQVNFKGGQVGSQNYFGMLREGKYIS